MKALENCFPVTHLLTHELRTNWENTEENSEHKQVIHATQAILYGIAYGGAIFFDTVTSPAWGIGALITAYENRPIRNKSRRAKKN